MTRRWRLMLLSLPLLCQWSCALDDSSDTTPIQRTVRHPNTEGLEIPVRRSLEKALAKWSLEIRTSKSTAIRAAAYAELGKTYLARHFYLAAADAFAIALQLQPAKPAWHYFEAVALHNSHQPEAALRAYEQAIRTGPIDTAVYYRAELLALLGDFDGARLALEPLLHVDGAEAAVHALAGRVAMAQTRYADAENYFRKALEIQADASALNVPLALAVQRQKRRTEARRIIRRAGNGKVEVEDALMREIAERARSIESYMEGGQTLMRQRKFLAAASEFAAAVDLNPANASARLSYGRALEILGDMSGARLHYSQALKAQSNFPVAHYFFGSFLERQGEYDAARARYSSAVEQDPDYLAPRLLLAHALFRSGDFAGASEHYSAIVARHDQHVQARFYLGLASLMEQDCDTALTTLRVAGKASPRNSSVQEVMARAYAMCSDDPDELSLARETGERLNLNRPDSTAAQTLAMVHAALQDYEQAISFQSLALQRSDQEALAFVHENLERYRVGQGAGVSWVHSDPVFSPPALTANKPR